MYRRWALGLLLTAAVCLQAETPTTALRIEVKNPAGNPVDRAAVGVRFLSSRSIVKLGKRDATKWELRTNQEGVAKIPPIPQGKILVQVIAKGYQTFGDTFEVYEQQQTLTIKLNAPQPQYSAH